MGNLWSMVWTTSSITPIFIGISSGPLQKEAITNDTWSIVSRFFLPCTDDNRRINKWGKRGKYSERPRLLKTKSKTDLWMVMKKLWKAKKTLWKTTTQWRWKYCQGPIPLKAKANKSKTRLWMTNKRLKTKIKKKLNGNTFEVDVKS